MSIIWLKLAIALCLTGISWAVDRFLPSVYRRDSLKRIPVLLVAFGLLRLVPYFLIYLVAQQSAQSDVTMFWDWASHASRGEVVYRDFDNDYAPGFPYILAMALWVWRDARSIVLLMILIELGVLVLTRRIFLQSNEVNENQVNRASLLYLMSPAPFVFTVLSGQEDVWLWGIGIIAAGFLVAKKEINAGLAIAFGLLMSKAFLVFAAAAMFWAARRPKSYLIGLFIPVFIGYGLLGIVIGEKILFPLRQSSAPSPPNVWFLLNAILNGHIPLTSPFLSLSSLLVVTLLGCFLFRSKSAEIQSSLLSYSKGWIIIYALLMVLSPKSFGNYVQMFLMPLIFVLCSRSKDRSSLFALTGLLSILACIQPSFWFRLGQPMYDSWSSLSSPAIIVEIVMEFSIVVILCAIIRELLGRDIRNMSA